jgi:hypothetical protein
MNQLDFKETTYAPSYRQLQQHVVYKTEACAGTESWYKCLQTSANNDTIKDPPL